MARIVDVKKLVLKAERHIGAAKQLMYSGCEDCKDTVSELQSLLWNASAALAQAFQLVQDVPSVHKSPRVPKQPGENQGF